MQLQSKQQKKRTAKIKKKLKVYPQEYVPIQGVAQVLDISERKAHELLHDHDDPIPFHRIGKKLIRVWLPDLHEWMNKRRADLSQVDVVVEETLRGLRR